MWTVLAKSRIAEDVQVRMTQPFLARGEEELRKNLQKLPWHCYLNVRDYENFKMP